MKKIIYSLLAAAALAFAGAPADAMTVADYPTGRAANGMGASRHNLGSFGRVITTSSTTEVCVFCHTPHHSNQANGLVPLWNRGSQAPSAFTAYGTTLGGSTINNSDIGSTTLACLSCHDGVTTFDNIVNAPGKGGVTAGGADRGWAFEMPGLGLAAPGWDHFTDASSGAPCTLCHGPGGDREANVFRLNVGTVLSNDHPVSVTYQSDKAGLRPTNTTIGQIDLTSDLAASATTFSNGNLAQNRWAVRGYVSDTATISDLLRNGKVECSSCHDPHFRNLSWDEAEPTWADGYKTTWCNDIGEDCSDGQFLRRVGGNSGSGICRTCHNK